MKKLRYKNITVYSEFPLLFKGYSYINLFGIIFSRHDKDYLNKFFKTDRGKKVLRHERIHSLQAQSLKFGWFEFYLLYIWYYLKLLVSRFNPRISYYTIPFEIEAYMNQGDVKYLTHESRWRDYVLSNKDRLLHYYNYRNYNSFR